MRHSTVVFACALAACAGPLEEDTPDFELTRAGLEIAVPQGGSIQAAIDQASPGDVVRLTGGAYLEDFRIARGVTVVGRGRGATIVRGRVTIDHADGAALTDLSLDGVESPVSAVGVSVDASAVTLARLDLIRFGGDGVRVSGGGAGESLVDAVRVTHSGHGVTLDGASGARVVNLVAAFNRGHGIEVRGAAATPPVIANALLLGNGFSTAPQSPGVRLSASATLANSILTSNAVGLDCAAACPRTKNLVWGNSRDYARAATPTADELRRDPRLVMPSESDFRLASDSPALDVASAAHAPAHDFAGTARPQGAGYDLGPLERVVAGQAPVRIVITEVMANPLDEARGEYVELYNAGASAVDLAGWVIDDGDARDTIGGWQGGSALLAAGAYAVVLDPDYTGGYGLPAQARLLTVGSATIGSGLAVSDPVSLLAADGTMLVDAFTHPFDPGNGVAIEKDAIEDGDQPHNWIASPCGATPGAENCAAAPPPPAPSASILINEVMANPLDEASGEAIELINVGLGSVDLAGWVIDDGDATDELTGWQGGSTVLGPGRLAVVLDPDFAGQYALPAEATRLTTAATATIGNGLSVDDPLRLIDPGARIVATYAPPADAGNGVSLELVDPQATPLTWVPSPCAAGASLGEPNCAAGGAGPPPPPTTTGADLVISEVMANPLDEDTGELVEIRNRGTGPVDLAGYRLWDGDDEDVLEAFSPGGSTVLAPGGFALVLDAEYAGQYAIPPDVVLLRTGDTTLGSGLATDDPVSLLPPGDSRPVATFSFPFNPGDGISAERVDLAAPDLADNWVASPCGASPGIDNCANSGDPSPVDRALGVTGLVISEVIANPLDERTGELVELYNAGPDAVTLAGYRLFDGDVEDTLEAYSPGGSTTLAPGQFAVVLDRDHAGDYVLPAGALRLSTDDTTIGDGLATNDPLTLADPSGRVVASFSFPSNPGNGKSLEIVSLTAGDRPASWVVSTCQPATGAANAYASPGTRSCADMSAPPTGQRGLGSPCPNGGADCASGLCAFDSARDLAVCTARCDTSACPGGAACVDSGDPGFPRLCATDAAAPPEPPSLAINEIVFDGPGTDHDVFVEIVGPAHAVVDGLTLVGVNGATGDDYNAITLAGELGADGVFVVAHPSASAATLAAADMLTSRVDFQNGPDSVQLRAGAVVLDALGYGDFAAGDHFAGEGGAAFDQPPGKSLGRFPDRGDSGDNARDFALGIPTPGAPNQGEASVPRAARLLISELVVNPTAAEMIEIHNPGSTPVDLSNVYLADYPDYHRVTVGGGAPTSADFRLRFPEGTEIAAGGYLTVSLESALHFHAVYGTLPDFDVSATTVEAPAMRGEYGGSAGLTNTDELVVLFFWDGASDLVTDLDYIVWGGAQVVDKTGISVGQSAYLPDTASAAQHVLGSLGSAAVTRCDLGEGDERASGGNGVDGADETSEDLGATFQLLAASSPGGPGECAAACVADCAGATCGDDGCGGTCGLCADGQICEARQCITPAGPLTTSTVTGWTLPAGAGLEEEVVLFTSASAFTAHFGVAPPANDFSASWLLFYSAGERNVPGHLARVHEVVDNTAELFVFTELRLPGEGCEVLAWRRPAWTLVRIARPASGATALTVIGGEDEHDCTASGVSEGNGCDEVDLCAAGLVCCGTTWGEGIGLCLPAWMHDTFEVAGPSTIPDGSTAGLVSPVTVSGLATVPMDAIVKLSITHPDPSQLTISMSMPLQWDGEETYEDVFWDRAQTAGPNLELHVPVGFVGDEAVNGVWRLKIVDHVGGGAGTLESWSLELTSRWD